MDKEKVKIACELNAAITVTENNIALVDELIIHGNIKSIKISIDGFKDGDNLEIITNKDVIVLRFLEWLKNDLHNELLQHEKQLDLL